MRSGVILPLAALPLVLTLAGCASPLPQAAWESRLRGDAIVLLGELHDNAEHHRQRLNVLRRAFAAGWRPAIAMEQFDRERQADIERARAEEPRDARRVIELAVPKSTRGGWDWAYYQPFVELALEYDVPLIAANLSAADTSKIVREGYAGVFDAAALSAFRLDSPPPAELQSAQEHEIDIGHCNALPPKLLPAMARGQLARDTVMADIVSRNAGWGVVLIAGNGHVRRDLGVPRWLRGETLARTFAVGYLEHGASSGREAAFDAVVYTEAARRDDPCLDFKQRLKAR